MPLDDSPKEVGRDQMDPELGSPPQKSLLMLGRDAAIRAAALLGISPPLHTGNGEAKDGGDAISAPELVEYSRSGDIHDADLALNAMPLQEEICELRHGGTLRFPQNGSMEPAWIREQLRKTGKTQRGLAAALGIDPGGVTRLFKGERRLRADEIEKVKIYLGGKFPPSLTNDGLALTQISAPNANQELLEVRGMAEGGSDGWNLFNGDVVQYITRPDNLRGVPGAYGVFVRGESMIPRYEPGEIAHIHPGKPVLPGAYVLVQRKPGQDGDPPLAVVKRLVRRSGTKVTLEQFNPAKRFDVPVADIVSIHKIVGASEG